MIDLLSKTNDFMKNDRFTEEKRRKPALLTRTCPPGLAKVGPDMTEVRVLVQFGTFRVQKWYFDEMT